MGNPFTLYYSPFYNYEKCPQLFLWSRGWEDIDVGGGPGRRKPVPVQSSKHHSIMGTVIQKVIEDMYNNELWRDPKTLVSALMKILDYEFNRELSRNYVDWSQSPSRAELYQTCYDGVIGYLKTMKANRLLGPYARAEVLLLGHADKNTLIGGRADMIIRRDDTGVTILDGKNSKDKGKYTSPDQVRWYALCYFLMYNKLPDRVGFVYYRYPNGTVRADGTIDEGIDWVPFNKADIEGLAERAIEARKLMAQRKFDANPSPKGCQFCEYETVCEARIAQRAYNARNRKKGADKVSGIVVDADGFLEM